MSVERIRAWFAEQGWEPFPYQEAVWSAYGAGEDGLVHVPTGMGKTLAIWGSVLARALEENDEGGGGRVLWVTPLRALARDTTVALQRAADGVGVPWTVERRTGDTSSSVKARQRKRLPEVLVTTPESLSLLLSYPDARTLFRSVHTVVVDEWHELLGTKRGTQTELGLARLRHWTPGLRSWGLSATLGNLDEALAVLRGSPPRGGDGATSDRPARLHGGVGGDPVEIETALPDDATRFPWYGHLGLSLLPRVVEELEGEGTALLFANTRNQAEQWFRALLAERPGWAGDLALHHGSLDREVRRVVEDRLRAADLRCVVCTSSLDLGVDFPEVDRVIQVGSPKGVARLLQRAGRSGHRPGVPSRVLCVPAHAFELAEFAAVRREVERGGPLEARHALERPLDVLAQHVVTVALGGGFAADELLAEVQGAWAYRNLDGREWQWVLDFVRRGGSALEAYPRYARVAPDDTGVWRPATRSVGRRHRMQIGTITSDGMVEVRFQGGKRLGSVEESFIGSLRPGDRFVFAGRVLELLRVRDLTARVRLAPRGDGVVPRWMGGRMPLSTQLGAALARELGAWGDGRRTDGPEARAVEPLLEVQARWSAVPRERELLLERLRTREGHHVFLFPFLGRLAHDGLSALVAHRLARQAPRTIHVSANDYGFEILSRDPLPEAAEAWRELLSPRDLLPDLLECINAAGLARTRFREIARVAGLVFQGFPGAGKSARQLQASSGLIWDVLERWDPDNLFLDQARREVLERELEVRRLREGIEAVADRRLLMREPPRLTPLAFPLWASRIHAQLSSESFASRVREMVVRLEKAAGEPTAAGAGSP